MLIALVSNVTLLVWLSNFAQCWLPCARLNPIVRIPWVPSTAQILKVTLIEWLLKLMLLALHQVFTPNITISWYFFRLTAPRCPNMAAVAVSLRKSHDIVISSFCNMVKGQANSRLSPGHTYYYFLPIYNICNSDLISHFNWNRTHLWLITPIDGPYIKYLFEKCLWKLPLLSIFQVHIYT